jgi:hypothetical protein
MLLGISLFGIVSANLAAFFVETSDEDVMSELMKLREQIKLLSDLLERENPATE